MFIMGSQGREFTPEYKGEAVKLVINTGRPVATVARELGIKEQTLGRWVNVFKARQEAGDGSALSETERVELARLRKEVSELKMDRAFLKKSVALLRPGSIGYERELVRVDPAEDAWLLDCPDASRAEMGVGRSMDEGWIRVEARALRSDAALVGWLEAATRYLAQRKPTHS